MARPHVVVRRSDGRRVDDLVELWRAHRLESGACPEATARIAGDDGIQAALGRRDLFAFIGYLDGEPAGYAVLTDWSLNPFVDHQCVAIEHLYVLPTRRGLGVARALLATVAGYADRAGVQQIASTVPSTGRDANRFYARLGFAPHMIRRMTGTAALRRRLADHTARTALDAVRARRRTAQIRAAQPAQLASEDYAARAN